MIRIGWESQYLPYAGFFLSIAFLHSSFFTILSQFSFQESLSVKTVPRIFICFTTSILWDFSWSLVWNWNLSVKFTIMVISGFNNNFLIFGPQIDFVQILLGLKVWAVHNLAVCWKVIRHLLLGVVWGNTDIDQIHNVEEGQIVDKLAAVFLRNTIGIVICSPGLTPWLQIQAWDLEAISLSLTWTYSNL